MALYFCQWHIQHKLFLSISCTPSRLSASRFSLGAIFRFLFWKNRTKCLQGTFDLKFFPPYFSGFIFSVRPAVRVSFDLARRLRQPCQPVRQRPPSAPAVHVSVRQPAYASARARLRQQRASLRRPRLRPRPRASPRHAVQPSATRQIKAAPVICMGRAYMG